MEEHHDRGSIEQRSRSDRAAIVIPSGRNHFHDLQKASLEDLDHDRATIVARSRCDRGPIVVRSWLNLRLIRGRFYLKFGSNDVAPENRPHDPSKPLPRPPLLPSKSGLISLFCSSTFDRFVKELSEFQGRSLVHRDPPAFRLNSEGIGAGLITNSSLISSNFPLEF